jgi:hypothetical protein
MDDKKCGPKNGGKKCTGTAWCSEWGWCGTTEIYNYPNHSSYNGPDTQSALNSQCRKDQLYVDTFGHNCEFLGNDPNSQNIWTDVTGKYAGKYCKKWCTQQTYRYDTPNNTQLWGCVLTQANNPRLNVTGSSDSSESVVRNACNTNPDCAGYYSNGIPPNGNWFIASNKTPENCDVSLKNKSGQIYPTFFRKL